MKLMISTCVLLTYDGLINSLTKSDKWEAMLCKSFIDK